MQTQTAVPASRSALAAPSMAQEALSLQDLFRGKATETHDAGKALFWEGDCAENIFEVTQGMLRVHRILPDGRRGVMGFVFPGDVLGVSHLSRYAFTAEAIAEVKVRRLSRARFFALVDQTEALRTQLFSLLCDEMSAAQDQMLLLGRKSAEERVASFLLLAHRKTGHSAEIDLPMGRLDIADYLGLTIETVSRTMSSFSRRGIVVSTGRHSVLLCKLATLRKMSASDESDEISAQAPGRSSTRRAVWPH